MLSFYTYSLNLFDKRSIYLNKNTWSFCWSYVRFLQLIFDVLVDLPSVLVVDQCDRGKHPSVVIPSLVLPEPQRLDSQPLRVTVAACSPERLVLFSFPWLLKSQFTGKHFSWFFFVLFPCFLDCFWGRFFDISSSVHDRVLWNLRRVSVELLSFFNAHLFWVFNDFLCKRFLGLIFLFVDNSWLDFLFAFLQQIFISLFLYFLLILEFSVDFDQLVVVGFDFLVFGGFGSGILDSKIKKCLLGFSRWLLINMNDSILVDGFRVLAYAFLLHCGYVRTLEAFVGLV